MPATLSCTLRWGSSTYSYESTSESSVAGYYRDGIGQDYANARYYNAATGAFWSQDPTSGELSTPGSLNRYSYVLGDPINHADPLGLCDVLIGGITQSPSDATTQWAQDQGAISAFPYAGGTIPGGVASVIQQGVGIPNGATATALAAIALAAQGSGPIDIVAFSGGAQAFTAAYNLLTPAVQQRIESITYVDPGAVGSLVGATSSRSVTVLEDSSDFANTVLQLTSGSPTGSNPPGGAEYVDTGTCGHNLNCVINLYGGFLATNGTPCDKGAGSTFGAPINYAHVPIVSPFSGWYYWFQLPDVPVVSSTIRYDVP